MILNDEEIQVIITGGVLKYSGLDVPKQRQAIDRDIAKTQLKKVVEWLETELEDCHEGYSNVRCLHRRALEALLEEVK